MNNRKLSLHISFRPIKLVDVELTQPLPDLLHLERYVTVRALVRLEGRPLGFVETPVQNGRCSASQIQEAIWQQLSYEVAQKKLLDYILCGEKEAPDAVSVLHTPPPAEPDSWPLVTVAICTRDRTADLAQCLAAVSRLDYPRLDVLVIDNAPSTGETQQLVATSFPRVRYVQEPLPGLNNARNRAILEARGEIIAYTDDDVIVDTNWVKALARLFVADEDVTAVTGLVVPYELETASQYLFEVYGGFGRGFETIWYRSNPLQPGEVTKMHGGTGKFGTGANMAFRRDFLLSAGGFDPALDVGTATNGGGDLEMFFRVLKSGRTLVYEPSALVRHRHRPTYAKLAEQIRNNGIGFYAYLVRNFRHYPEERWATIWLGLWWFWWWSIRRLIGYWIRPYTLPRHLVWTELWGSLAGLFRYGRSQKEAAVRGQRSLPATLNCPPVPVGSRKDEAAVAVRTVDLQQGVTGLNDVAEYRQSVVYVTVGERPLGQVNIENFYHPISRPQLCHAIVSQLSLSLLAAEQDEATRWISLVTAIKRHYRVAETAVQRPSVDGRLPVDVPVSIVIATFDRPHDLRRCLHDVFQQQTQRRVEIIVVDNHPDSGVTASVVADFPEVVYVAEKRQGLSYARNAGICASTGDVIVCTDDDVSMPPDWLEKLLVPFTKADVMVVTGNVLPREIETQAQQWFETYGGLGRGFAAKRAGSQWFESFRFQAVPTWLLGATANAAFRATIFDDPHVGLLDERLGVGSPTGCSEDTMLFYQVLRAGHSIVYEPTAYVWHSHRNTYKALRKQLYSYSKGHVAYHLMTLVQFGDLRALFHLCFWLPRGHLWRLGARLLGRTDYPLRLNMMEIAGNLMGPWALWRSHRRRNRLGRCAPYVRPQERVKTGEDSAPVSANGTAVAAMSLTAKRPLNQTRS